MLFKSDDTRRKITLVAGLLFFIGMSQSLIASFVASNPNPENSAQAIDSAPAEEIDLEGGYQIVLEREPNNQTALQGLVEIRLAKENWAGVIAPLDQLITLNPTDENYMSLRKLVDDRLAQTIHTPQATSTETKTETP